MNKVVLGVVGLVVVLGGAFALMAGQGDLAMSEQKAMEEKAMMEQKAMEEKAMMEQKAMEEKAMMEKDDAMMEKDGAMMEKDDAMMEKAGTYAVYSSDMLAKANDGDVVLFFKASWCPSCRALDADIKSNLGNIPAGVTILEVDFDNSADLRSKYGVTQQHTLVQVDAAGNQIAKWGASRTLNDVVAKIQ